MSEPGRSSPRAGRSLATVLVAAQIAATAIAIRDSAPAAYWRHPSPVIPAEQRRDIRFIRGRIPDDEPLLFVSDGSSRWIPRTWERALSPEPVAFVLEKDLGRTEVILRRRFGIRWAISAGNPPADPGFSGHWQLEPLPGSAAQYWFGRLSD